MTTRITVGETGRPADEQNLRGTISAILTTSKNGEPMIAISAALMSTSCSARLTIEEAERLRDALNEMITIVRDR